MYIDVSDIFKSPPKNLGECEEAERLIAGMDYKESQGVGEMLFMLRLSFEAEENKEAEK